VAKTPDEIELEIKRAREALAAKVDALAEQLNEDVEKVKEGIEKAKEGVETARNTAIKVAAVAFVAVVGILALRYFLRSRKA
jgi:hypothetical protein